MFDTSEEVGDVELRDVSGALDKPTRTCSIACVADRRGRNP
jgi:hypothetical protein